MYMINDNKAAIKTLQRYLAEIYSDEASVNVNGIFDNNTLLALHRFQKENNLDIKDYVDYESFTLLYNTYIREVQHSRLHKDMPKNTFPIKRGDQSSIVAKVNSILHEILEYYNVNYSMPYGNYYSDATQKANHIARDIFNVEKSDMIDETMYLRLIDEWKSINKIKNNDSDYFFR